ncbi:MAG: hypothetical protein QXW79_00565 [Thermoplasmata archaeon]
MSHDNRNLTETVFINGNNSTQKSVERVRTRDSNNIYGLSGIVNMGSTCYMNSAIQCLSHIYLITDYFFNHRDEIMNILKRNAHKIFKDVETFKIECKESIVPLELRKKIQDPSYHPSMLTPEEETIVLNHTITFQLVKLLENMWNKNCIVIPTSFFKVFSEARNNFFFGSGQHDSEEAYSCIVQKMQEELGEKRNIVFKINKPSVQEFLDFKNKISEQIQSTNDVEIKKRYIEIYKKKKKEMPVEALIIDAYREMKNYYGNSYSRITEIFSGFLHSRTACPKCGYMSNNFEPFLHLSLSIPTGENKNLTIEDCMQDFCKEEILDEKNLWFCENCSQKVQAVKRIQVWSAPIVLVIQFKRFDVTKNAKNSRMITYPLTNFNIVSIISEVQRDKSKCYEYTLQCVIKHVGDLGGGHYFSYCRDEDTDRWFSFDDRNVVEINKDQVVSQHAYLLFYIRQDILK